MEGKAGMGRGTMAGIGAGTPEGTAAGTSAARAEKEVLEGREGRAAAGMAVWVPAPEGRALSGAGMAV